MKRATRGFLSFATAFLIVFSTFGNAFLVAEASEPTAIEETVTDVDSNAEVISDANAATVGASKEETVTGDVIVEGKTSEETEEIKEEADTETVVETVEETDAQKSVDLTVTASEEDGYVTLSCGVDGSTIYYSYNEDGKNGFVKYEDKIKLDTSKDIVIWAYASYDSESMDAVDGEKVKFEYKAAQAVDDSKAVMRTFAATAEITGTKASELNDGDKVAIVVSNRALTKNTASNNKLDSVEVSVSDDVATLNNDVAVFTVESLANSYVAFKNDEGKYLATPSATTQGLVFADELGSADTDCGKWVLEDASGHFNVKSNTVLTTNSKNQYLSCKNNAFSVLTNNASNKNYCLVDFYVVEESASVSVAAPTASVESGSKVEFGSKVELSCATEGAKIMYSLDGKEFKSYESAVEITKNATLSAYAELDGTQSDRAEFKYELVAGSKITDVTKLEADQDFVLVFNNETALTGTASSSKLAGADVKVNDDKHLTYTDENASFVGLNLEKAETEGQLHYF